MKLVPPHRIVSRECTYEDIKTISRAAHTMREFFGKQTVALAHPQVEDVNPLRFFVLAELGIIPRAKTTLLVNPKINRHSGYTVDSEEGCQTWPEREVTIVQRWRMVEVEYQTLSGFQLSAPVREKLKGFPAFVFQHELDHLNGKYCYDHKVGTEGEAAKESPEDDSPGAEHIHAGSPA